MERGFFFWAPDIKNRFTWLWWSFQSSYWLRLSLRGNLRYLQSCPRLQGHLIDTNGRLSWICITVTLPSAVVASLKESTENCLDSWFDLKRNESGPLWFHTNHLRLYLQYVYATHNRLHCLTSRIDVGCGMLKGYFTQD